MKYYFLFRFKTKRKFATFYLPKLVIVGLMWLAAVALSTWQVYRELADPTYSFRQDTNNFLVRNKCRIFVVLVNVIVNCS